MLLHASAFAYQGAGCLILGPSGSGKSRLVAEAITLGATLIADDQVVLSAQGHQCFAAPVSNLAGLLELHGMGIIHLVPTTAIHPIHLVVELVTQENERLPEDKYYEYSASKTKLLKLKSPHVPSLLLYLAAVREGRILPQDALLVRAAS